MLEKYPLPYSIGWLFWLCFLHNPIFCQQQYSTPFCGTEDLIQSDFDLMEYQSFRKTFSLNPFRSTHSIPVRIHIAQTEEGVAAIAMEDAMKTLENANTYFIGSNLEFVLCGPINFIKNSKYFNYHNSFELEMTNRYNKDNVINVYFVNSIIYENTLLCGYSVFPWMEEDFVFMTAECSGEGNTLAHEFGHYLGLFHTHTTVNGRELVNQSNCEKSGDLLCDTQADPQLGWFNVNSECIYTGLNVDTNGDRYQPDPTNIMSYSLGECRDFFSEEQFIRMHYYLETSRSNLDCINVFPDLTVKDLNLQENKMRSGDQTIVELEVNNVGDTSAHQSKIEFYLSEDAQPSLNDDLIGSEAVDFIDSNQSQAYQFSLNIPYAINTGQFQLLACLDSENEIDELDEDNNCMALPMSIDNSSIGDLTIFPNPVVDQALSFLRTEETGIFEIFIYNSAMSIVRQLRHYKPGPELFINTDLSDLSSGLYIIKFRGPKNIYTMKFLKL